MIYLNWNQSKRTCISPRVVLDLCSIYDSGRDVVRSFQEKDKLMAGSASSSSPSSVDRPII
jgi:hypothetical protein